MKTRRISGVSVRRNSGILKEFWTVFRRMADEAKLGALPLLLKDGAAVWYNTQPRGVKGDLTELRHSLIDRYGPSATDAWKRAADLWKMRQQSFKQPTTSSPPFNKPLKSWTFPLSRHSWSRLAASDQTFGSTSSNMTPNQWKTYKSGGVSQKHPRRTRPRPHNTSGTRSVS